MHRGAGRGPAPGSRSWPRSSCWPALSSRWCAASARPPGPRSARRRRPSRRPRRTTAPTTTPPAARITLAFAGDVHFAERTATRLADEPGHRVRRGRRCAADGRPDHGQPGDRGHRAGHPGAEGVPLPHTGDRVHGAAGGGRRRGDDGQQPRRRLRRGRPRRHAGRDPVDPVPDDRDRRRRRAGVRAVLRDRPRAPRRPARRQPDPRPHAHRLDRRADLGRHRVRVRRPAGRRRAGGPRPGRDRGRLPALGRRGPGLPQRRPARARRPAGRGRRRRGRRHPRPPAARAPATSARPTSRTAWATTSGGATRRTPTTPVCSG